jgi:hypothetical protein
MPLAPVAADIDVAADILLDLSADIPFHPDSVFLDGARDVVNFLFCKLLGSFVRVHL